MVGGEESAVKRISLTRTRGLWCFLSPTVSQEHTFVRYIQYIYSIRNIYPHQHSVSLIEVALRTARQKWGAV